MKTLKTTLAILIIALSGCAIVPKVLEGDFSEISPSDSKKDHVMNLNVRWSGYIVQTINNEDKTCFEIVETETYKDLSPKRIIPKNGGRFLACKDGFLEPTAFDKRMVTITGKLVAYTQQNIGDFNYEYPVVKTNKVYIWRKNPRFNYNSFNNNFFHHRISRFSCMHSSINGYCY